MPETDVHTTSDLNQRVKALLRRDLKLGDDARIDDDMPLVGGEFELDSLDVVILISSIEKEFGVKLPKNADMQAMFATVRTVVDFLAGHMEDQGDAGDVQGALPPGPDLAAVLERLPHADPFRFLSSLQALTPGVQAEGTWDLSGQEPFFAGHFPGRPVVPGVLIGEALAQLSGTITAAAPEPGPGSPAAMPTHQRHLAHVDVRFKAALTPPATIRLKSRLIRAVESLEVFEVQATLDNGTLAAEGTITLALPGRHD